MAIAIGLAVASNYYAQPLLYSISTEFKLSPVAAGSVVTVAQLSYALGIVMSVPLGDILERRSLVVAMSTLVAAGLALSATANSLIMLMAGNFSGAAFGSLSGSWLLPRFGGLGVCALGVLLSTVALVHMRATAQR